MPPSKLQPALLGGAVLGVLSVLPIVSLANCCCIWFITGGLVAAWVMQQNHPLPIAPGDGAIVGLLAGVFGALVWLVLSIPLHAITGGMERQLIGRILERAGDLPPDARASLERWQGGGGFFLVFIGFCIQLIVGSAVAAVGGLVGALLFRKEVPPQAPPFVPPATPPPPPTAPPPL
jgi:hypothetical protein